MKRTRIPKIQNEERFKELNLERMKVSDLHVIVTTVCVMNYELIFCLLVPRRLEMVKVRTGDEKIKNRRIVKTYDRSTRLCA